MKSTIDRYTVADLLVKQKDNILHEWEMQSREQVPAAKFQTRTGLRNSLPLFLNRLIETLRGGDPAAQAETNAEVARAHAEDRADQPEYTLNEVLFEYHIFQTVIIKNLEDNSMDNTAIDSLVPKIIHEFIDRGIGKVAVRFTELAMFRQVAQAKEIEAARLEAERASKAKSVFLANMSHEIRTPLGAIMGFVGLLKDSNLAREEITNYLSIIDRNSHHLLRIIDDILDLNKVETGKMLVEKTEFSLLEFVTDFSGLAGIKARDCDLVFELKADTLLPEFVTTDPERLRQILSNVVGNAIKFTEKGRVELAIKYDDHYLDFRITDTGRGICKNQVKNLFQAFAQVDSSTTRRFGGTGVGLVLTKKLCQTLGGDFVLVESSPGVGSTFEVCIPVTVAAETKFLPVKKLTSAIVTDPEFINLKGLEILLVEDSLDNQFLVQKMLGKTGAKVSIADDGAAGMKMALARKYDVVLMDIQMPVMDGHDAVIGLRSKGYTGPIVALTAHAMKEERERAAKSGFSYFLTKPINKKTLTDLLGLLHNPLSLNL